MTTDSKHTPGPWTVSQDLAADMSHMSGCIRDAAGWSIAYVTGMVPGTAQANAALIARAPELLAENERLRSALEHLAQDAEAMGIEGSAYSGSLIEAHAALKGEV